MKKYLSVFLLLVIISGLFFYDFPKNDISLTAKYKTNISPNNIIDKDIDFYFIEKAATEHFTDKMIECYKLLTDGILNYQSEINVIDGVNDSELSQVMYMFADGNPLYSLVEKLSMKNGKYIIEYRMNEYNHYNAIDYMEKTFKYIISHTESKSYCTSEKILAIYNYFSSNYEYDYEAAANGEFVNVYDFLKNGSGVCHSFSRSCRFVLYQLGINTASCKGYTNQGEYHEWFIAEINGEWYHFDPTYEHSKTGGNGLRYFGITDDIRIDRDGIKKDFNTGTVSYPIEAKECNTDSFKDIWSFTEWGFESDGFITVSSETEQSKVFDMYLYDLYL